MEVLNFEILRIVVAILGVGAAAYQDYKTSFIDDKILYLMIGIGVFLNFLDYVVSDSPLIVYSLIVSIVILLFGYAFYKKGQLGMGDVLLFVAIQQVLPLAPTSLRLPFAMNIQLFNFEFFTEAGWLMIGYLQVMQNLLFFITIFLVSSFLATLGSSMQYAITLLSSKIPLKPNKLYGAASLIMVVAGGIFLYSFFGLNVLSIMFFLLFLSSGFFLTFRQQILDEIIIRKIPISAIEDEDILAIEKMPQKIVQKYHLEKVLTQKQVAILRKIQTIEKIKLFPVNKILPRFGPYIFVALILGILLGNIIEMLLLLK
jgi:hypothetical protein